MRQPTFFIPHGAGPCFFMEWTWGPADTWDRTAAWLKGLVTGLPERPQALLVVSGIRAHSLALLSEAGHNLSDFLALLLSLFLALAAAYFSAGVRGSLI